jgi:hypothetical protein
MPKHLLAVGAAVIGILAFSDSALALSKLTVHRSRGIPLPAFVTSNRYWLYAGRLPRQRDISDNWDYIRLVAEPVGNIVPVGPDYGFPW